MTDVTIAEVEILKRKIGFVHLVIMSTFHGGQNATVAVSRSKAMLRNTGHPSEKTIVLAIDETDVLGKRIMVVTTGNVHLATTSTFHSEQNVTNVENQSQVAVETGNHVHVVAFPIEVNVEDIAEDVIPTDVEGVTDDVTLVETEEDVIPTDVEGVMDDVTLVETEEIVIIRGTQTEAVITEMGMMVAPTNATEKHVESVQVMLTIEGLNRYVHVDIKEPIVTIEVN